MNLEQMEYIVYVANERSITKAAEKLFISPSGMSQSITQLENELGVKIFNRAKHGITPTFEGQIVLSKAIKVLNAINELNNEIADYKISNQNHLKIVTAPTFTFLLQETMLKFNSENHDVTFEIEEKHPEVILQNFNKENYDLALIPSSLEELKKEKNIRYEHIYKGYICIAVGKNSPFYFYDYVTASDLVESKLVTYHISDYKKILKLAKLNFDQVLMKSNRSSILFDLVKESKAILFVHDFSINNRPMVLNGEIKIIPLKEEEGLIPVDFWLIYLETKGLRKVAKEFMSEFTHKFNALTKKSSS